MTTYDESKEPIRCGVGFWSTSTTDPLTPACEWHDDAYTEESWAEHNMTRVETDKKFLGMMLVVAGNNPILKAKAYLYYTAARVFGARYWEGKV